MTSESEFGKGLVICLVKFAEHSWRLHSDMELHKQIGMSVSEAIEMHFNGASDHLYEIEVPEKWKGTEIDKKVKELQDMGLKIGHGFTHTKWTEKDAEKLYQLCREIALLIDKELGINALMGSW
jgi:hypothetical protein